MSQTTVAHDPSVYGQLGVSPFINASGELTRLGGSLMLPAVRRAMDQAARKFVRMAELEEAAGVAISRITGAESGYVTSGCAAALTLAAAATIAGDDAVRMNRLPDTAGIPNEIVIPFNHRDSYDRCFRLAGGRVITAGRPPRCSADDLRAVISRQTAAVAWFSHRAQSGLSLQLVVDIAHSSGVAVIVDASLALPPAENLTRLIATGADLVAFSSGKAMRGPQSAGILAGRADLIRSVAMQNQDAAADPWFWKRESPPPDAEELGPAGHGVGRPMKVAKEQVVGAVIALQLYAARDHDADRARWLADLRTIQRAITGLPGVSAQLDERGTQRTVPVLTIAVGEVSGLTAEHVCQQLRSGEPRIEVGFSPWKSDRIVVIPSTLQRGEARVVGQRIREACRALAQAS